MNEDENIEKKLARWMEGELSQQETSALGKDFDLDYFQKMDDSLNSFPRPVFDTDDSWDELKDRIPLEPSRKRLFINRRVLWISGVAASLIFLIGLNLWTNNGNWEIIKSDLNSLVHVLPCGSEIILAPSSQISYDPLEWAMVRKVILEGNGYFDIQKGNQFTVVTTFGEVKVLGTKFSIQTATTNVEIKCFEGSVEVANTKESKVLNPGDGITILNNKLTIARTYLKEAPWIQESTQYSDERLETILLILEEIYNVKFEQDINLNRSFNGTVLYNNLDDALRLVFEPLDLKYKINGKIIQLYEL